ncbi:MAG: acyl-CoA dehydrogenase family protein [Myxococcota bacterium]
MNLELPELHATLAQTVGRFATSEVAPHALAMEEAGAITPTIETALADLDLWSLTLPEDRGGAGLDALAYVLVVEALAAASPSVAHRYALHAGPACASLASSDLPLDTVAAGAVATWSAGGLAPAASSFLVRPSDEGAVIVRGAEATPVGTMALRAAGLSEHAGGEEVARVSVSGRRWADLGIAAASVGAAQGALDAALAYALERQQFGRPIAKFQAIQWKIADAATHVDAARIMVQHAACEGSAQAAARARAFVGSVGVQVASDALQIHGGYGYTREYPVERFLRALRHWGASVDEARLRAI